MKLRFVIIITVWFLGLWGVVPNSRPASKATALFQEGVEAARMADFTKATDLFRRSLAERPASGTLLNLGVTEWRRGHAGEAILAWEQVLWLDPYDAAARRNLDFARTVVQLDQPELRWYEAASMWLPPGVWGWLAAGSLWLAVAMFALPRVRRWRKAGWHQGLAVLGLGVFLLSGPAIVGLATRSHLGVVLERSTPARLTPTEEAESLSSLAAGEVARAIRVKGNFVFVRTSRDSGWIKREQFGSICPRAE